jgi:hypothetical protein
VRALESISSDTIVLESAAPASGLHSQGRCLTSIISTLEREHEGGFGHSSPSQIHLNCRMTVPSEIVGAATPVLLAFLAIHSRAARLLASVPALSW